ncbi:motility associated factor glycosyltransferase family protein [Aliarcobacter cryaerophilus]|uniref:motility associated factor glycosyltransferase family protein n=1 Tax=Aliarcobacter cryaerophilus TaxID=28198 RepID=UPI001B754A7A|nr:6-hydroxymethylpterin diphosphokinase MptE-like protein [Aliarcobacter cryaerophilus]MBP6714811.1 motility associated factor glycosyltransferase family protein [Aliarcobacter sp.]MCT7514872.1 DUF115 domain-containing protein [Aliarcobacter cryaerophilus]
MTEVQIQLQNALTTTFLANLAFLSEYDNELYHRVDELSRMIENGTYKEKYYLEFIMEDGEFDIYDVVNDKYLYGRKPKKFNNNLISKVNFDQKNSIIDIPPYFSDKNKLNFDREKRFELNTMDEFNTLTQCDVYEYTSTLNGRLNQKKRTFKKLEKFIFLGTLLGRHIPKIANKVNSSAYLVLERNLEIFRLSLFTVDYTVLAKKGVIFSIMNDYLEEELKIKEFLSISIFDNYMIKFSTTGINIEEYIDKILSTIKGISPILYDYNRRNYVYINRTTQYLKHYKFLQFDKIKEKCNIFKDNPILYLAAGPSLDENIEWIKKNQDKFYIVTIGSAYKKLLKNDIKIDMITTLDEQLILSTIQFDDESVSKISKDTVILASTLTNAKVLEKFSKENIFLYEPYIPFFKDNITFSGYSIGEITLDLILHFNAKKIYTIGLDLALNQNTGESHSKGANSGTTILNLEEQQSRDIFDVRTSLIKVKGNLKKDVFTTALFYISIKDLEKRVKKFLNKNLELFNLSTHGAYLEGLTPLDIEKIDINKFAKLDKINLKKFLQENSETHLDEISKEFLRKELDFIDNEIKEILDEVKSTSFRDFDEFKEKIILILEKTFENHLFIVYQVFIEYFAMYIPFLSYYFNDTKIKNENKQLNKAKDIFASQITSICEDFKICLERVI